jgi:hypothetical protein
MNRLEVLSVVTATAVGAFLLVQSGASAGWGAAKDHSAAAETRMAVPPTDRRQPTADECAYLQRVMPSILAQTRIEESERAIASMKPEEVARFRDQLERAITDSLSWLAAGCPDHPVLGVVDLPGGGYQVRLLDWPGYSGRSSFGATRTSTDTD